MSLKFGTSGLRGLSVDLKGRPSYVYAAAFAHFLLRNGLAKSGDKVLVAYDFRDSSPAIAANVLAAIRVQGLTPVDCGLIPTPALAFYAFQTGAASMMVTGSHIPADRNGIKFYLPDGEIAKPDEQAISAIAAELSDMSVPPVGTEEVYERRIDEATALFLERNGKILPDDALAGLTVGNYQHSTVARDMLSQILRHYGAKVVDLGRSEEFIPVDTEAVSPQTLQLLKAWSQEHGLDAIVSADGDGDRPLIADETGQPVSGDICGLLTALFLGADAIVTPITSNSGIDTIGSARVLRTKVGSPFVIAGMEEASSSAARGIVGFEANGGTLTASVFKVAGGELQPLPTRDSFLPILAVLSTARRSGKPVSEVKKGLGLPVTAADRLENCAPERSAALMAMLRSADARQSFLQPFGAVAKVDETDGLRVTLADGRVIHLRPSGNAPEMRCYVEASGEEAAADLLADGLALLRRFDTQ